MKLSVPALFRPLTALCSLLLGGGALAACSPSDGEVATGSVPASFSDSNTSGSVGSSEVVGDDRAAGVGGVAAVGKGLPFEVGEWDVNDPDFRFFDPCTEIPAEVFAEAGLGEMTEEPMSVEGSYSTCRFFVSKSEGVFSEEYAMIYSDLVARDKYEFAGISLVEGVDSEGVEMIREDDMGGKSCSTSMVTSRGRWGVEVFSIGEAGVSDFCGKARDVHSKILRGIKYGNV